MFCNKCGDPIEPNEKFCNKCGTSLNLNSIHQSTQNPINGILNSATVVNDNYQQSNINIQTPNNKKNIFIGAGIGIAIFLVVVLVIKISSSNGKYYFDNNPSEENDEIVQNNEAPKKKGKYETSIVYDNTYSMVNIGGSKDAFALIIKDSVNQKDDCLSDIKKIEDTIINNYGITAVNLCEMDVNFAKEVANVFKKIYNDYPSVRGNLTNLTLVNAPMSSNYIAAFMPVFNFATSDSTSSYPWIIKTQVLLNTSYFLNQERLEAAIKDSSNSGHFPKNTTIYSPVAHELGHYLSFLTIMKHYNLESILLVDNKNINTFYSLYDDFVEGNNSFKIIKEAYENYKNDTKTTLNLDEWRGKISNYAVAKNNGGEYIYDETIAEAFHDVYLNGDDASDVSKYVVSVLNKKLGN